ncbi:MAG: NfeD family protein, partial [Defluviitaleaceae bacterium]|nr:NfeD family protein [Defluviitaleaceae bacterium]
SVIAVALVVAGGIGYLWSPVMPHFVVLPAGLLAGTLTGLALQVFVFAPLHRAQNTSTVDRQSLIGKQAKVTSVIPQAGFGKIEYEVNGSKVASPAKGEGGCGVSQGTAVEIVYIENNVYFVRPLE